MTGHGLTTCQGKALQLPAVLLLPLPGMLLSDSYVCDRQMYLKRCRQQHTDMCGLCGACCFAKISSDSNCCACATFQARHRALVACSEAGILTMDRSTLSYPHSSVPQCCCQGCCCCYCCQGCCCCLLAQLPSQPSQHYHALRSVAT